MTYLVALKLPRLIRTRGGRRRVPDGDMNESDQVTTLHSSAEAIDVLHIRPRVSEG